MTVGVRLEQARRERGLSLADVTKATKIQPWVLEALEADRLQEAMSPIYVKGFLATYARFLRLDPTELLAQLRWPQPEPAQTALPPARPSAPVRLRLPLPLLRRVGAAALAASTIAAAVMINPIRWLPPVTLPKWQAPRLASSKPAAGPASVKKSSRPAKGSSAPAAERLAKASPPAVAVRAASASDGPAPKPIQAEQGPKLASLSPIGDSIRPSPSPVAVAPVKPLELTVSARRTTWIQVRADGKLLTQQRLQRGAQERWAAKKRIELIVAKPSQVELMLNGQPISPLVVAHRGRLLITHQGVTRLSDD